MHPLLNKFLNKRGVKSAHELDDTPTPDGTPTEKQEFERIKGVLSKEKLEADDIKKFCEYQRAVIEHKWNDTSVSQERKNELLPYYTVYRLISKVCDAPQREREAEEKRLEELLE